MYVKILLTTLALALPAAAAGAVEATFECTMTNTGRDGFVGDTIYLSLSSEQSAGAVFDYFVNKVYKAPIPAKVTKRNNNRWRYVWKVENFVTSNEGSATIHYRALLNANNGKLTLSGRLAGYDNVISGAGQCKVVKR